MAATSWWHSRTSARRIDIGDYFGSSARIERELGWQAQMGLDAGLRQTLAYFGRFGEHYWP